MAILTERRRDPGRITSNDYQPSKMRSYFSVVSEGKQTFVQGAASIKLGSELTSDDFDQAKTAPIGL